MISRSRLALAPCGLLLWALVASQAAASPVELDRIDSICCPSDVDRTGDYIVAAYDDVDEYLGLRVFDYSDPAAPVLVSELPLVEEARAVGLAASGHAYVAAGDDGLIVVDVSNLAAPVVVGSVVVVDEVIDIEVSGARAYLVTPWSGLRVFDLSQPTSPVEVGAFDSSGIPFPFWGSRRLVDAAVAGDVVGLCFAETASSGAVVQFVDFADAAAPVSLGTDGLGSPPEWQSGCNAIAASATHFYTDHGFVSIYNPGTGEYDEGNLLLEYPGASYSDYRLVANLPEPGAPLHSIVASGSTVHAARGGWLQAFDASQPQASALLSSFELPSGFFAVALSGTGTVVFGAAGGRGIGAVDVADATAPVVLSYEHEGTMVFDGVAVDGALAVAVRNFDGLWVIDVSTPSAMVDLAHWPIYAGDVALQGAIAYVAVLSSPEGVQLVDLSTPESPVDRGFAATPGRPADVEVQGAYAYVAAENAGLRIFDVSDPDLPVEVASVHPPGRTIQVELRDGLALVLADNATTTPPAGDTLTLVDVSDPTLPVVLAEIDGLSSPRTVERIGDHVFVVATGSMKVFDISDPTAPLAVTTMPFPYYTLADYEAVRLGERIIVPLLQELVVVDASDPAAPFVANEWLEGPNARGFVIEDGILYRAEVSSGFASYALAAPFVPVAAPPMLVALAALLGASASWALQRDQRARAVARGHRRTRDRRAG